MDTIDKKILKILQNNGRISNQELADEVGLSPSPCLRRVKQLEESGIINKYVAIVRHETLNIKLTILTAINLNSHDPHILDNFNNVISKMPEIIECYLITGQKADYILKIVVPDLDYYHKLLLKQIVQIEGVSMVHSSFILQKIIDKTELPLDFI